MSRPVLLALLLGPGAARAQPAPLQEATGEVGLGGFAVGGDFNGAGVSFPDLDGDGWPDLIVPGRRPRGDWVCRNAKGRFSCRELLAALPGEPTMGSAFSDVDRDGAPDVLVLRSGVTRLYLNVAGDLAEAPPGTFPEGALGPMQAEAGAFADYDRDGWPDLYVATGPYRVTEAATDVLLRNRGDGTFADVGREAGVQVPDLRSQGQVALWLDADDDGWLDLYVGRDAAAAPEGDDLFFRNRGDGGFDRVLPHALGPYFLLHTFCAMGGDAADFDGDGDLDIYLADGQVPDPEDPLGRTGNTLYVQQADGSFRERARALGAALDWSWAVQLDDFDGDGALDLFAALGEFGPAARDCLLAGRGAAGFGPPGCAEYSIGQEQGAYGASGSAAADVDRDGDPDLVVHRAGHVLRYYRNDAAPRGWLRLALVGVASDPAAIGAVVELRAGGRALRRDLRGSRSKGSQGELPLTIGLGEAGAAELVRVRWPSGRIEAVRGLAAGREHRLVEGESPEATDADVVRFDGGGDGSGGPLDGGAGESEGEGEGEAEGEGGPGADGGPVPVPPAGGCTWLPF